MNIIMKTSMKRSFLACLLSGSMIFANACTTWIRPTGTSDAPIRSRAQTEAKNGIKVSAAVVGDNEARQVFGIDLAAKKIQAVWLEIENRSNRSLVLLPTAIDPDIFAPLEVAFAFHKSNASESNMALKNFMLEMNFPVRRRIEPKSLASGYIFTNWSKGAKPLDIDLFGDRFIQNFTLIVPDPNLEQTQITLKALYSIYPDSEQYDVKSDAILRDALEQLPCCATTRQDARLAEPLNVVIIGEYKDWATAFNRRGYRYRKLNARFLFGRTQDLSGEKSSGWHENAQEQTLRIWQTPIRYQGKPVWVGQTSTRLGGRFADKVASGTTLPLNPKVDESRDDLTQDLAYSQALSKIGYVKGAGCCRYGAAEPSSQGIQYATDGLRAVLVFDDRPVSLSSIEFFEWERLADYR